MFVFPLKWLPWIMVIGGICLFFTEGGLWPIILVGGGGAWLYFSSKEK